MLIKTHSKEWNVDRRDFHVFDDIDIDNASIYINIKDHIFENIVSMLAEPYYLYRLNPNELIQTYQAIDYLQVNRLMKQCAKKVANYMNDCSINKLTTVLREFALL